MSAMDNKAQPDNANSDLLITGLNHSYWEANREIPVLHDLNLRVGGGEILAILGRSGCGKSTLLNLISGIEPTQSGSIQVGDLCLSDMNETERTRFRRRHIGFIYQFFNLFPTLTTAENIASSLELNSQPRNAIAARTRALLEITGLAAHAGRYPDQLSGGEQQRVAIARALAHRPRLILADEPTGNLDAESGETILSLLTGAVAQSGATLLLVTHSLNVASRADRILTLENGHLEERSGDFAW